MIEDLVRQAQAGNHDAFERLAGLVARRMYGTASLIVRDPEGSRDAVQDALIEAWRNMPTLRDPAAFEAWTRRILVRCCYRAIRDRQRRRIEVSITQIDPSSGSHEGHISEIDELDRAFRRLTPDQRAVLVLHHRLGLPLDETAEALAIPIGTVKSRLNRATAALRAALLAEGRDVSAMGRQPA